MHVPKRQIFRESAIQHYIKNREKDVLLRIMPLPMAVFLWVLLSILFMAGLFAWNERIPTYVGGAGIVQNSNTDNNSIAVVFLPAGPSTTVQVGEPARIQIGSLQVQGTVTKVATATMSPDTTRTQFQLQGNMAALVTQPSLIVLIRFTTMLPASIYAGSSLSAQIEVGSQRILSQLPWIGQLLGN
jgi:hypothetical protein